MRLGIPGAGGALFDLAVYPLNFAGMVFGNDIKRIEATCVMTDRRGLIYGTECTEAPCSEAIEIIEQTEGIRRVTLDTVRVIEPLRVDAGIEFPGDR